MDSGDALNFQAALTKLFEQHNLPQPFILHLERLSEIEEVDTLAT